MTDDLEDLKRRLVVGHKRDGRSVYDEKAKSELVALCLRPGASVSRLARECGVNANQVGRWLREHGHGRRHAPVASTVPAPATFVAVPVLPTPATPFDPDGNAFAGVSLQARLPNGVAVDLRDVDPRHIGEVIEALGRLRCSASTKG
ncbi:transposase [Variovorax sp. J22R24]|uniref:IS66-like element accessory protein TnpA n=1 Tax=Variovorax gracilis TaxID=3053502 RepID=UPI00257760F9|nr:transposase [Variovorax sp. J22R24]MDM0110300.1 transposase [Variovorax sp. J22R24]